MDPLRKVLDWCEEARRAAIKLHDAVCLATCTAHARPSARMVLFRGVSDGRLVFYTDYRSRKAEELEANPFAALVFHWKALGRQIRLEGAVERVDPETSDRYFLSRPRGSRISARTSHQSQPVADRETLERRHAEVELSFEGREVTRPDYWGGYGLRPSSIEFWNDRPDRLHDRILYRRVEGVWESVRLEP